jgi:hypothetical protein
MKTEKFKRKLRKIKRQGEQYKIEKQLRDMYAEYWPEHKKRKTSNIMLAISTIAIVGYVVADWILQYKTGMELSPSITPYWFGFWTGEIFLLAGIKVSKVFKDNSSDEPCG